MGDFYESLYSHRNQVLIVCQYIFIVIRGPELRYTTAVIHTDCSLVLLKRLAVASTSLGKGLAFGAAVNPPTAGCVKPTALVDAWRPTKRRVRDQGRTDQEVSIDCCGHAQVSYAAS
jgi:hypothetical protein